MKDVESGLSFELTGPESKTRIQLKLLDRLCPSNNQDQSLGSKENFSWRFLFFGRLSPPSEKLGSSLPLVLCFRGEKDFPSSGAPGCLSWTFTHLTFCISGDLTWSLAKEKADRV